MAEYTGQYMVAKFNSVAVNQLTRVSIEPKAAEPDFLDATHAEDTERQEIEGMAGAVRTRITVEGYDVSAGTHTLLDLSPNDQGTFLFYPQGTGTGMEKVTVSNARFMGSPREFPFGEIVKITGEFFAVGEPTYGTAP
jgi:hypothetical protein